MKRIQERAGTVALSPVAESSPAQAQRPCTTPRISLKWAWIFSRRFKG
ncbi:rCG61123 [Rattus norvegicus]|uniref:RCG61123 n=1 Tax=Rattus norvegicus TaxID=10116 RepID=A6KEA8_RAT|nr:rCG61123 [Rattus norvegicus]